MSASRHNFIWRFGLLIASDMNMIPYNTSYCITSLSRLFPNFGLQNKQELNGPGQLPKGKTIPRLKQLLKVLKPITSIPWFLEIGTPWVWKNGNLSDISAHGIEFELGSMRDSSLIHEQGSSRIKVHKLENLAKQLLIMRISMQWFLEIGSVLVREIWRLLHIGARGIEISIGICVGQLSFAWMGNSR